MRRNTINALKAIIRENILLTETGEDDEPKVRVRDRSKQSLDDVWDDVQNTGLDTPGETPLSRMGSGGRAGQARRNFGRPNVNLRSMGAGRAEDMLAGDVDPDFDFNAEFERGIQSAPEAEETGPVNNPHPRRARHNPVNHDTPDQTRTFQPNVPAVAQPTAVGRPIPQPRISDDPRADIRRILEQEFVSPAMGVGMRVLPAVWGELRRLAASDPATFVDAFSAALNEIRMVENTWFADLLGMQFHHTRMAPAEGTPLKRLYDRIMEVLNRYYKEVLGVAAENSNVLFTQLNAIQEAVGEEEFKEAFFDVLSETRDQEDNAFAAFMGVQRRLR